MQFVYICFHDQSLKLYLKVCHVLFFLFEYLNLSFGICYLCLVAKCYLDFFHKVMKSSQSQVSISSSSLLSFHYVYIPATPPLRCTRIAIILSSVFMTLLLLKNNLISLYQSSNFILSLLNYPRSRTMLFGTIVYIFSFICSGAVDISSLVCLFVPFETLFMIFNDPSLLDNILILFVL